MDTLEQLKAGQLVGATRLTLSCGLSEFPREIFDLADTLEILDLSGNELSSLPEDLPRLHRLRILFCSNNLFTELPAVLGRCHELGMVGFKTNRLQHVPAEALPPMLRWLILTDNQIAELPEAIGQCAALQKLMLAGNRLSKLPTTLANCHKLELLRISANALTQFPAWLCNLPRLAWLAYGSNPFCAGLESTIRDAVSVEAIEWEELEFQQKLGEGASGVIHRALHHIEGASSREVAVKLFKGAMTSDGLPHNEMLACICAGNHPNLVSIQGRLTRHPDGVEGLVMSLIDSGYRNLAGPPSLDSCTRDIYSSDASFDLIEVMRIAYGIAAVMQHLHAQGILHGDLYAHNILHGRQGDALLGDFGAASFLATNDRMAAEALQRIEVRAYGCLLEELLQRLDADTSETETLASLRSLQSECVQEVPVSRPLFEEIVRTLSNLRDAEDIPLLDR